MITKLKRSIRWTVVLPTIWALSYWYGSTRRPAIVWDLNNLLALLLMAFVIGLMTDAVIAIERDKRGAISARDLSIFAGTIFTTPILMFSLLGEDVIGYSNALAVATGLILVIITGTLAGFIVTVYQLYKNYVDVNKHEAS